MKRNLEHLNNWHLRRIERWLEDKDPDKTCPFEGVQMDWSFLCEDLFPKLRKKARKPYGIICNIPCPCTKYELTYVKQVAKQVLKERRR